MQRFALFFLLFFAVEIYGLFVLADHIGALWTFLLVVAGFAGGSALIRNQVISQQQIRIDMMNGQPPALSAMDGMVKLFAGVLLMFPGVISDILGLLLLIPPLRQALLQRLLRQMVMPGVGKRPGQGGGEGPTTIDGEYRRLDDD